jgi:hypothetical protein
VATRISDDVELINSCRGCGEPSQDLARIDAIVVTSFLQRRFASLLADPPYSFRHRDLGRGAASAMQPADHACAVLAGVNQRVRDHLGEEALDPIHPVLLTPRSVTSPQTFLRILASLAENVRRLTATISGATTEDWRHRHPDGGATAGELVWRALHEAIHHLEEAGILLDGAAVRALTSHQNAHPAGQR